MTFSQSIGIIMGANIGTTITAIIVGFDLFQYASFFLIIGAFCLLFSNHPKIKRPCTNSFWAWLFILWIRTYVNAS